MREKMFREFPGCPKANVWDKVGMCIMLVSFAGIVVGTVGAIIHLPAQFNGPVLFIATYLGVIGYLCTSHASTIYVKYVRQKAAEHIQEEKEQKQNSNDVGFNKNLTSGSAK